MSARAMDDRKQVLLAWSGGKDSLMALWKLPEEYEVVALLTNVNRTTDRVSIHGVRRTLIESQVEALGLPVSFIMLPDKPSNEEYEALTAAAFAPFQEQGIHQIVYGDLFLQDIRQYRDAFLGRLGMQGIYPLWSLNTSDLIHEFIEAGFRALITCVDTTQLDAAFTGRAIDHALLNEFPVTVDPCGENGEFHTFVYDGPLFSESLSIAKGETWLEDHRFSYGDILNENE